LTTTSNGRDGGLRWLLLAAAVIALDRLTKVAVVASLARGEEIPVTGFMSFVLAYNSGAAFSFLAGETGWQRWFFTVIAIVASVFLVWLLKRGGTRLMCAGLAFILGGALGNLWDRIAIGKVIDFLLFHYGSWSWPAFNVADSAITIGAALLIFDSFRPRTMDAPVAAAKDPP